MVLNLIIGCGTPPLGLCLFIGCGIAKVPVEKGARAIVPFLIAEIIVLFFVTYIPSTVLYIPKALGYM